MNEEPKRFYINGISAAEEDRAALEHATACMKVWRGEKPEEFNAVKIQPFELEGCEE